MEDTVTEGKAFTIEVGEDISHDECSRVIRVFIQAMANQRFYIVPHDIRRVRYDPATKEYWITAATMHGMERVADFCVPLVLPDPKTIDLSRHYTEK